MFCWKGNKIQVGISGSSHSSKISVEMKGFPNEEFSVEKLQEFLCRRKGGKTFSTSRVEEDVPNFVCGVENGKINGKIKAVLLNSNVHSSDYANLYGKPRPSHADYAAYCKDGRLDFAGGGEFSGRMTAPLCVAGGIALQLLSQKGIDVFAYVSSVGKVQGLSYKTSDVLNNTRETNFPSLSNGAEMLAEIDKARTSGNSVGGIVECVVSGQQAGIGGALFDGIEGKISYLLYSIPAVKGVEFGLGFDLAKMCGDVANDSLQFADNKIVTTSNNSGGINGGITNGMPITLSVAFRPTPSISKSQQTVDLINKENVTIAIKGRHDPCIVPRAVPVVEAAVSLAILDVLLSEGKF